MHLSAEDKRKLLDILMAERETVLAIIDKLKKEQESLVNGKVDDIFKYAAEKDFQLYHLNNLYKQQCELLQSSDSQYIILDKSNSYNSNLNQLWTDILDLISSAKQLNNTNETIVSMNLQYSQNLSFALHGNYQNHALYNARGMKTQ